MRHGKQSRRIRGSCSSLTVSLQSAVTGSTGHGATAVDLGHGPTNSGLTTNGITTAGTTIPAMIEASHFAVPSVVGLDVPSDTDPANGTSSPHILAGRNNNLIRDLQFQIGYTQILDSVTQGQAGWTQGDVNASGLFAPFQGAAPLRDSNLALIGNWHEVENTTLPLQFGDFAFAGETATSGVTVEPQFAANDERSRSFTPLVGENARFRNPDDPDSLDRETLLRRIGFGEYGHTGFGTYGGNFRTAASTADQSTETNISAFSKPNPVIPDFRSGLSGVRGGEVAARGLDPGQIDNDGLGGELDNDGPTIAATFDTTVPPDPGNGRPTVITTPTTTKPPPETTKPTSTSTVTSPSTTDPDDGGTGDEPVLVMRQGRGIFVYDLSPGNLFEHFPGPGDRVYGAGLRLVPRAIAGRLSDITDPSPSIDGDMHFRLVGFTGEYNFTPEATQHMTWNFRDITSDTTNGGVAWAATGGFGTTDSNLGISTGFTISAPVDLNAPITVNVTELVQDALDNHDGFLRFMLMKEPDNNAAALGAVQFYGWAGRENQAGRQDFEPDLFVRYMPVGSTNGSGAASGVDMGIATVEGATHPGEKFIRRDARRRHEFYPPKRRIPR
mgnify:FL=1